jgi:inositol 1,4,5-triphosphate receptor type 3
MLFKEGGALTIQKAVHAHLFKAGSEMFFRTVRGKIQGLIAWHKWNGVVVLEEDTEPELPADTILIRCLQLMCEGHFGPNQDLLRDQPNNVSSINLLDDMVVYLQALDPIKCRTSTAAESAVSALVLEVLQGPCVGNQDYFALSTELLETINKKIRQRPVNDCDANEELELKKGSIEIMQALLEGQGKKTAVYERMLSVIHIDVILVLCKVQTGEVEQEESEESINLRVESLVLLQMLIDFRPALKKELAIDDDMVERAGANVSCIEVLWRGELQRRFFLVPKICDALAKSTKDNFIATVKRASPEDKLYGLLEASKDMYREIKHQKFLQDYRVDKLFSRTNQDWSTWASFFVVLTINLLFLFYYTTKEVSCSSDTDDAFVEYPYVALNSSSNSTISYCTEIHMGSDAIFVTEILNYLLIAIAFFTLLLYFVVRVPVNYRTFVESNIGPFLAILYTSMDLQTIYYFLYLAIAVVGVQYHAALTFLLLDFISKSATSRSVLLAIYNPRKQLFMTTLLTLVFVYIFAMFQVIKYFVFS